MELKDGMALGRLEVGGREVTLYLRNMKDMVYNIHDICGRQWHIMLARVRIN